MDLELHRYDLLLETRETRFRTLHWASSDAAVSGHCTWLPEQADGPTFATKKLRFKLLYDHSDSSLFGPAPRHQEKCALIWCWLEYEGWQLWLSKDLLEARFLNIWCKMIKSAMISSDALLLTKMLSALSCTATRCSQWEICSIHWRALNLRSLLTQWMDLDCVSRNVNVRRALTSFNTDLNLARRFFRKLKQDYKNIKKLILDDKTGLCDVIAKLPSGDFVLIEVLVEDEEAHDAWFLAHTDTCVRSVPNQNNRRNFTKIPK